MKRHKGHHLLTFGTRFRTASFAAVCIMFCGGVYAQDETVKEMTGNTVLGLTGNADTLWMVTKGQKWGVNYTLNQGKDWWGLFFSQSGMRVIDLAFGNRTAVVVQAPPEWYKPSKIWYYSHKSSTYSSVTPSWPRKYLDDTLFNFMTVDAAYGGGDFYFASLDGGLLRWSPGALLRAYRPGESRSFDPQSYTPGEGVSKPDTAARVMSVSTFTDTSGTKVLVAAQRRIWRFSPSDSSWDTAITVSFDDTTLLLHSFLAAATGPGGQHLLAYADVGVSGSAGVQQRLFTYTARNTWKEILDTTVKTFSFAGDSLLYVVRQENQIGLYALGEPGDNPVPVADNTIFQQRIAANSAADLPSTVNDILFTHVNDTAGNLWIASSYGLYHAGSEVPGSSTGPFTFLHHAPAIKGGLEKTYAYPGILTSTLSDYSVVADSKTTFAYNLGADAKVTIRIYDYNMDLVKTVISNQPRRAGGATGRSTNRTEDVWNGTNRYGKPVAPGVYYYKITTDIGERSFGKIIVAK